MPKKPAPIQVETQIREIRGQRVILDQDRATLYAVSTKVLLQAVKRNAERFPSDFVFSLGKEEFSNLRSQSVTSSWGGRRYLPLAFTAEGVAMLSGVLSSPRAIKANIAGLRAYAAQAAHRVRAGRRHQPTEEQETLDEQRHFRNRRR